MTPLLAILGIQNGPAFIWTLVAGIGAIFSARLVTQWVEELRGLGTIQNGRRLLARGRLASEVIRLVVHSAFFLLGLLFIGVPGAFGPVVVVLIAGNFLLIVNSAISLYIFRRLEFQHDTMIDETQIEQEDREFGTLRRKLEATHATQRDTDGPH